MRTKFKKTYFSVTALQDGTIVFATQTRKPVKSSMHKKPTVDEDGIHNWYFDKLDATQDYKDWGKTVHYLAVVHALNMKRIVREQVEGRLARIEDQLAAIAAQLERMAERVK